VRAAIPPRGFAPAPGGCLISPVIWALVRGTKRAASLSRRAENAIYPEDPARSEQDGVFVDFLQDSRRPPRERDPACNQLNTQGGRAIERAEAGNDPFEIECAEIAERWAIGHVIQGCYIEEYHQWEKAVKQYFKGQRELNGLSDDFDWKLRRTTLVRRVMEVLAFFGTTVDPAAMNAIDSVRNKVNWLKHDPLSCHVDHADYEAAQIAIKSFWDILVETESKHFA
jgi:hypothetical protein